MSRSTAMGRSERKQRRRRKQRLALGSQALGTGRTVSRKRKYSEADIELMCTLPCAEARDKFGMSSGLLSRTKQRYGARNSGELNGGEFSPKPWSKEEIEILGKISDAEHAERFGRSKRSVNLKRFSLGIPSLIKPGRPKT